MSPESPSFNRCPAVEFFIQKIPSLLSISPICKIYDHYLWNYLKAESNARQLPEMNPHWQKLDQDIKIDIPTGTMQAQITALSHIGDRNTQEDSLGVASIYENPIRYIDKNGQSKNTALIVIADGMGGHNKGEVASQIAVETVINQMKNGGELLEADPESIKQRLVEVIETADTEIKNKVKDGGTTVVAALLVGSDLYVANVGDSRAYLKSNKDEQLKLISRDHSWVFTCFEDKNNTSVTTLDDVRNHPNNNIMTHALGEKLDVHTSKHKVNPGDCLALCTDGQWGHTSEPEMADLLNKYAFSGNPAYPLLHAALENGASDNVTTAIVRFHKI